MTRKIHFISLGCDKNLVDSEAALACLDRAGFAVTDDEAAADAVIINTCGFIEAAVKESIDEIIAAAALRRENGEKTLLIVTGCLVNRYRDEIRRNLPEIDAVFPAGDFEGIIGELTRVFGENAGAGLPAGFDPLENRMLSALGASSYLKIAEGCDSRCTYCTIPKIRGPYRSRPMESLLREARRLARGGVSELTLVAQDTALYGADLYGKNSLAPLLRSLREIEGIEWLRLMYAYPEHLTPDAADALSDCACHYLDMPVQSGSGKILKLMGRQTSPEELRRAVYALREKMPDIALRTTFITGFPGEGEAEFEESLRFMKELRFDRVGAFAYSREEGTPAALLPGQLSKFTKTRRRRRLMSLAGRLSEEKLRARTGLTLRVLTEGRLPDGAFLGRSFAEAPDVDGSVVFASPRELMAGDFVNVKITKTSRHDMYGFISD
ncbi:MAG: 30S ribosomal protein S12 methylthiotransferase RimO [Clostridiales bacterium]|jgi:ribosomal protein S12 methylthiotransferase|nr:30S ribosomal protein S12 methylthiotransferase RimO [Clostridiales bacterium]